MLYLMFRLTTVICNAVSHDTIIMEGSDETARHWPAGAKFSGLESFCPVNVILVWPPANQSSPSPPKNWSAGSASG